MLLKPSFVFLTGTELCSIYLQCRIMSDRSSAVRRYRWVDTGAQLLTVGALDSSSSGTWRPKVLLEILSSYFFFFFLRPKDKVANFFGLWRSNSE